jgi:hypothetical protein
MRSAQGVTFSILKVNEFGAKKILSLPQSILFLRPAGVLFTSSTGKNRWSPVFRNAKRQRRWPQSQIPRVAFLVEIFTGYGRRLLEGIDSVSVSDSSVTSREAVIVGSQGA